jgi:hypothetical protein
MTADLARRPCEHCNALVRQVTSAERDEAWWAQESKEHKPGCLYVVTRDGTRQVWPIDVRWANGTEQAWGRSCRDRPAEVRTAKCVARTPRR